jgi:hypothetical protein
MLVLALCTQLPKHTQPPQTGILHFPKTLGERRPCPLEKRRSQPSERRKNATKEADLGMMLSKRAMGKRFGLLAALVGALLIACTGVVVAQSSTTASNVTVEAIGVPNGGFETGDFTGWNVRNQIDGSGDWFVYSGTLSPLSGFDIAAPPQGNFAATTDQTGPGSHVLYRNIKLASGMEHRLSFYLYYENRAGEFFTPRTLDYTVFPNQQYRVDILRPKANPFTVDPDDIRATLFRTRVGDPNSLPPTLMTFDLTRFAGKTVRLRFAEVDNQFYFLASVDRVRVRSDD